jgi:GT2 family glycosyltransferase
MTTVAVIIVTWNSAHLVEGVLQALAVQTLQPARTLLVDNGSDDVAVLASIVARFPGCELLRQGYNSGFAAANNVGIWHCEDVEFVALLNPDAFAEPNWLAALVAAAQQYPRAAAFGSRLLDHADPTRLDGAGDYLTVAGKPGRRGHGQSAEGRFLLGKEVFAPCAAAAMYRRPALTAIGGFDEQFFCYVEDIDLAFRLLLVGYGSRYVPDSVVRHMGSALTGRRSEFSIYHGQRNLIFNYVKNMPRALFWLFLGPHLLLNIAYLLVASLAGSGPTVWRAKRDALRQLPAVWAQRRTIQSMRRASTWRILKLLKYSLW